MVIWVTGLSGAGKTTLCQALASLLKPSVPELVVLDGDVVRATFGGDLSYRQEDRIVQIRRLQGMAKILAEQGQVVIVGALYAHPDLLRWNRDHFDAYYEVYLRAPLDLVRGRDEKGLYAAVASGATINVVGVDIPWHEPTEPDMVIDAALAEPPATNALRIAAAIPRLAAALQDTALEPSPTATQ